MAEGSPLRAAAAVAVAVAAAAAVAAVAVAMEVGVSAARQSRRCVRCVPARAPPDVTHDGTQMVPRPQHFEHLFSDEVPSTQLPKLDLATQTILAEQEALRQQMGEGSQM